LELTDDDFNPIEIYAYYLGLYINNLNNGIFMDYILSFPVTYEVPIRDKIIESFEKGLKKSLPAELGEETINRLTVTKGASEPAAYALTALQQYGFEPEDDERVFYSVFDFGGGTTDFDFGIYCEPTDRKDKRRFDYVIEHFGAGGDKFLGGENLLELLAFEVFKKNKKVL
ncbi:molecular chaperone DnaK, partial [Vibrio sp. Vb2865]|nr:molecular chaperone DnaK [Vibrio sp. Vb2865]